MSTRADRTPEASRLYQELARIKRDRRRMRNLDLVRRGGIRATDR